MKKEYPKSKYFRFGIVMFLWLLLIGGLSYAYFSIIFNTDEKTSVDVVSGVLDIDFITGEYINNSSMWPISDDDVINGSDKSVFSVTRSQENTVDDVYYNIYIDDLVVSNEYKSEYIKWRLYSSDTPNDNNLVSYGTFENINQSNLIQLNQTRISLPKNVTHTYTLFIWISNNENENQTDLLNGHLEGKIRITAVTD